MSSTFIPPKERYLSELSLTLVWCKVPYSGKLQGENFREFWGFVANRKGLLCKFCFSLQILGVWHLLATLESISQFFFSMKNFHQFTKVFPIIRYRFDPPQQCESFSTYLLYTQVHLPTELEWWAHYQPWWKVSCPFKPQWNQEEGIHWDVYVMFTPCMLARRG